MILFFFYNVYFIVEYILGKLNKVVDLFFCLQVDEFKVQFFFMDNEFI